MTRLTWRIGLLVVVSAATLACDGNPTTPTELPPSLDPETLGLSETAVYLSDLEWSSMQNGWGPAERDRSNGERGNQDGNSIRLDGRSYTKGLGVHASSVVRYQLGDNCTTFISEIGVDDEVGGRGTVVFRVWVDGRLLYESPLMRGTTPSRTVNVPIRGVSEFALEVGDGGDGEKQDHADWAGARVICAAANQQ